jgi:periplasmic protein TonB
MVVSLNCEQSFLRTCLVEGDPAQEARARCNKRRSLFVSIILQILIVTAIVLFPLFSKGENIAGRATFVPAVPYSRGRPHRPQNTPQPPRGHSEICRFCAPPSIPPIINTHDPGTAEQLGVSDGPEIPGVPGGPPITGLLPSTDANRQPPPPTRPHAIERRRMSEPVINAMLIHRVDPAYPALARQLRREGRVELHAIIATDGSIQSLEIISGDPLFIQSALAAVREWRYRPTILDGQAIEVDTQITVIYTLNH